MNPTDEYFLRTLLVSLFVGVGTALIGVHLFLRRLPILGLVMPQVSLLGGLLILWITPLLRFTEKETQGGQTDSIWALTFVGALIASIPLAFWIGIKRHLRGLPIEVILGTVYVLGVGGSLILIALGPHALHHVPKLFQGQILAVTGRDLIILMATLGVALAFLIANHRTLFAVGIDSEFALAIGHHVAVYETLFLTTASVVISVASVTVGPALVFAYSVCPVLAAWFLSRSVKTFVTLALLFAAVCGTGGTVIAFELDLPVGSTQLVVLALGTITTGLLSRWLFHVSWLR